MAPTLLPIPHLDPAPIFELYRGSQGTELLTAAAVHFGVFGLFEHGPLTADQLRQRLGLADRPFAVLVTALRAFDLLTEVVPERFDLTPLAREHLQPSSPFDVTSYLGLAADSPGVLAMVERLRSNRPAGSKPEESGAAFIYREGIESAMEQEAAARRLTLALAGRARICAPVLAERLPLPGARRLLDLGGGTGLYSIAYLQQHPRLEAIVWDRPEVLKVAVELAAAHGVADRLHTQSGDMFTDPVPAGCDVVLLSNVLHDWDIPECRKLLRRCAEALPHGGCVLIHDVFLNDAHDGPLAIALYSAALFSLTEGRAYSAAEYRTWLTEVGLTPKPIVATLVHCGVLPASKNSQ
jgi:SAM-dependent methyltransferase